MSVTTRHAASTPQELYEVGGWVHDAHFDWQQIEWDAEQRTVTIPFWQESTGETNQAGPEFVAKRRFGATVLKVPFVRCRLIVRQATGVQIASDGRDEPGMLNYVDFHSRSASIRVKAAIGPGVSIAVNAIDVEIALTDEAEFWKKRLVRPGGGHLDSGWREKSRRSRATLLRQMREKLRSLPSGRSGSAGRPRRPG